MCANNTENMYKSLLWKRIKRDLIYFLFFFPNNKKEKEEKYGLNHKTVKMISFSFVFLFEKKK